jgi:hypothetical protein
VTRTPDKRTAPERSPFSRVQFTDAAIDDLHGIKALAAAVLGSVFAALKALDQGTRRPTPLKNYAKTGDLRDYGKIVVETDGHPDYRIVVREVGDAFEIIEVVTVEERANDLAYLLAGVRLGRINDPLRRSDTERKIARIRKLRSGSHPPSSTPC